MESKPDKETAPWAKKVTAEMGWDKGWADSNASDTVPCERCKRLEALLDKAAHGNALANNEIERLKVAAECRAPAPQPADAKEWLENQPTFEKHWADFPPRVKEQVIDLLCRYRTASAPQVTPELELEKEPDGRWIAEFTRFPGVAAYGPSKEEAIRNAAKVLIEAQADFPAILERERTLVAEGVTNVKKAIKCREWLTEGRGSYEWNDDRWHGEFAAAISEILTAIKPLERIAADWTNCPHKWEDVQKAREELKGKP